MMEIIKDVRTLNAFGDSLMFKSFLNPICGKITTIVLTNPSFLLKFFDDAFQACVCPLSSHV